MSFISSHHRSLKVHARKQGKTGLGKVPGLQEIGSAVTQARVPSLTFSLGFILVMDYSDLETPMGDNE
jgi:hypothetical protein